MTRKPSKFAALSLLPLLASGCATVAGTAVSPITGGIDLTRYHLDDGGSALVVPFVFVGGAVGGPFVALWNGIRHDGRYACGFRQGYALGFPQVFRPYEMAGRDADVFAAACAEERERAERAGADH